MSSHFALLTTRLTHPILRPDDAGYEQAAAPWNLLVRQHPLAIAFPNSVTEVQAVVRASAEAGLGVIVQPRGHGASGSLEGCVLIRPDSFDEIVVDAAAHSVRVGAGVVWGDVLTALEGTGLMALAGSNPEVSVVGYSLSGGHSAFSRAFGLASDAITAIELVDAAGELRRITAESDPEGLWAMRGGGGLFGVVTALEFTVFPVGALYGGKLSYPDAAAEAVFRAAVDVMSSAPNELSLYPSMMSLPDLPMIPEHLRGATIVSVDVVFVGDPDAGEALIAPLRAAGPVLADTVGAFAGAQLGAVSAEPTDPTPAHDWSTGLASLDGEALDGLVAGFRAGAELGVSIMQLRPLGGALAKSGPRGVADVSGLAALCFANVTVFDPAAAAGADAALDPLRTATAAFAASGNLVSFASSGSDLSAAYDESAIARLRAVAERFDPDGVFHSNRPLPER